MKHVICIGIDDIRQYFKEYNKNDIPEFTTDINEAKRFDTGEIVTEKHTLYFKCNKYNIKFEYMNIVGFSLNDRVL